MCPGALAGATTGGLLPEPQRRALGVEVRLGSLSLGMNGLGVGVRALVYFCIASGSSACECVTYLARGRPCLCFGGVVLIREHYGQCWHRRFCRAPLARKTNLCIRRVYRPSVSVNLALSVRCRALRSQGKVETLDPGRLEVCKGEWFACSWKITNTGSVAFGKGTKLSRASARMHQCRRSRWSQSLCSWRSRFDPVVPISGGWRSVSQSPRRGPQG